jgi:hypothetical protein
MSGAAEGRPLSFPDFRIAMRLRRLLNEPLVHFLVLGGLLFLLYQWRTGGAGSGSNRIVITQGQVASLQAGFQQVWLRPATDAEFKGLIDDYVREEIAVREATAQGLEQGDIVIRRRLRQKFEFLAEDEVAATGPTDAELQAWLDAHPGQFRREPLVGLRQVFISTDRRGASARVDADRVLARLKGGADPFTAGDVTMLPFELEPSRLTDIARQFGETFATTVATLEPGQWTGPVESGFGLHLVYVTGKTAGSSPPLDQVRDEVTRELLAARRTAALDSLYQRLSDKYRITIERPVPATP